MTLAFCSATQQHTTFPPCHSQHILYSSPHPHTTTLSLYTPSSPSILPPLPHTTTLSLILPPSPSYYHPLPLYPLSLYFLPPSSSILPPSPFILLPSTSYSSLHIDLNYSLPAHRSKLLPPSPPHFPSLLIDLDCSLTLPLILPHSTYI